LLTHRLSFLAFTNPKPSHPFHRSCREQNPADVICFTKDPGGLPYTSAMAQKTYPASFDPQRDIGTDYALIGIGVSAALIALVYLILI
jgi:hypothetical protein